MEWNVLRDAKGKISSLVEVEKQEGDGSFVLFVPTSIIYIIAISLIFQYVGTETPATKVFFIFCIVALLFLAFKFWEIIGTIFWWLVGFYVSIKILVCLFTWIMS